jgi:hypothetical protein
VFGLLGCSDSEESGQSSGAETASSAGATTTTSTSSSPAPTTTGADAQPLVANGNEYTITWAALPQVAFYDPSAGSAADPFFHIHTHPATDGFFFAFELYTTGYGALWTGQLGTFDISCAEPPPAPNSTGICPHFDADGPGGGSDLGADGKATGSVTINKVDDSGYEIVVNALAFSDGSTIKPFTLSG